MALPTHVIDREKDKFDPANRVKTYIRPRATTLDAKVTEIGETATTINIPEGAIEGIYIMHNTEDGVVYLGKSPSIEHDGLDVFPLIENEYLYLNLKNTSTLYGVVESGTINLYVGAIVKE